MTDSNKALRLADELEQRFWPTSTHYYMDKKAAAELRCQHEEITQLRHGAAIANQTIVDIVAQRDQLVQVLKDCEIALRTVAKDDEDFHLARHQVREVRAVIRAVEEKPHG